MSFGLLVPALAVASLVVATARPPRRGAMRRVARVGALAHSDQRDRAQPVARVSPATSPVARLLGACGAAALALVLLASGGGAVAVVGAAVVGGATWWTLTRFEPAGRRRARERAVRDLPFAVDLFASCVAAGATTDRALALAGEGVGGPTGAAFVRASAALALGASTTEAVAGWSADPVLAPLAPVARLLVRSATSGTALVPAATRLAGELRDARRWHVDTIARRVGVRATAPLGACFLPAFVLLGIVPLVVAGGRALGLQ